MIKKELDIVEKAQKFNSFPIPHEILKNSDKDIQSKMQKFNNIRQKRIRILESLKADYERLMDPREILCMIDDAVENIDSVQNILTASEYKSVRKALTKKRKKVYKNTKDIRTLIKTKEKKTGIENFYIQEARYLRMEKLRTDILNATALIKQHPTDGLEVQLDKLKTSYDREKQFASVIEKLDDSSSDETIKAEVKVYEEQINSLQNKIQKYKKILNEQQEIIKNSKKELIILWKMEINATISKKKESLELPERTITRETEDTMNIEETEEIQRNTFEKLKRISRGKHACT